MNKIQKLETKVTKVFKTKCADTCPQFAKDRKMIRQTGKVLAWLEDISYEQWLKDEILFWKGIEE